MAGVSAIFTADFSKWKDAVDKAQVQLKTLDSGAANVQQTMNRLGDSFSGRKIINDANIAAKAVTDLGGASTLTAKEQASLNATLTEAIAKYTVLGKKAPQEMIDLATATKQVGPPVKDLASSLLNVNSVLGAIGLTLSAGALVNFAKSSVTWAGGFKDMAASAGVSIATIQKFGIVGAEFGATAEEMARGVYKLTVNLGKETGGATGALQDLGISVKDFQNLSPEEKMLAFADAVARVEDPTKRLTIASEVFGDKVAQRMLPGLADLRKKMDEAGHSATLMSDETVEAANKLDQGVRRSITTLEAWIATAIIWLAKNQSVTMSAGGSLTPVLANNTKALDENVKALASHGNAADKVITNVDLLANRLAALRTDAMVPLSEVQKKSILELDSYGESQSEIAKLVGTTEIAVHRFLEAHKESVAAAKLAATAVKEYQKALAEVGQSIVPLNPIQEQAVRLMHQYGINAEVTAKSLKLTTEQVNQYLKSLEDAKDLMSDVAGVAGKMEDVLDVIFNRDSLVELKADLAGIAGAFDDAAEEAKRMSDEIDSALSIGALAKGAHEMQTLNQQLESFAGTLTQLAQVSDGTFGGIIKDIAEVIVGWNMAAKAAEDYAKATTNAGKALAIAQGVTGVAVATQGGGIKGTIGGALAGAELGSMFGPWGTAAGAAIGAVVGIFRTGISQIEQMGRSATDSFVSTLQSALTIQQQMEVHQLIAAGASAKWAGEVVGLRQAYLLAGETSEAAASKAAEWTTRLWAAEKLGGNAVALLIDQINIELAQMTEESKKAKDEADKAAAAAKALADELDSAVKSFSGEELFHQADIAVQAVEKIGGVTKLTADEQKSLHDLLEKTIDKYKVMGQEVPPELLAIWRGLNDIATATTNISQGAIKAYQDLLALRGFASGGGGEGESETRNISDLLKGLSESEAEQVYLNVIAPGSKHSDWERVKHQYGYAMGTGGFMNFGAGTPAILHGEEKVVTRAQDTEMKGLHAEVKGLREDMRRMMDALPYRLSSAVQLRH